MAIRKKKIKIEDVERFEMNLLKHAVYLYKCETCGTHWGRYIDECMVECSRCGTIVGSHVMVVEPETLISAWLNKGKAWIGE